MLDSEREVVAGKGAAERWVETVVVDERGGQGRPRERFPPGSRGIRDDSPLQTERETSALCQRPRAPTALVRLAVILSHGALQLSPCSDPPVTAHTAFHSNEWRSTAALRQCFPQLGVCSVRYSTNSLSSLPRYRARHRIRPHPPQPVEGTLLRVGEPPQPRLAPCDGH